MQPHWVPPAEIRARLAKLAALGSLQTTAAAMPQSDRALPRELAHDRWLRAQLAPGNAATAGTAGIAPGAMAAIRQLAPLAGSGEHLSGWLLEPVHFHVAKDHLVLVAGAAGNLEPAQAQGLAETIRPLLAEDGATLTVASPAHWLLGQARPPLRLDCASSEAAAGRNVDGYLPSGADARRYRRLLNEIQMSWHEHPVNRERATRGEPEINSVWLSGPVEPAAVAAFREAVADGRYLIEESLLGPRLRDDRFAWLDALQGLDERLHDWLTAPHPPAILLCGDNEARWLQRERPAASRRWAGAVGSGLARMARFARIAHARGPRAAIGGDGPSRRPDSGSSIADPLARLFTEAE